MGRFDNLADKPFERGFLKLQQGGHSVRTTFADFLSTMVICLANNNLLGKHDGFAEKREEEYMRMVEKYGKDGVGCFIESFVDLVKIMEENPFTDYLGEFYMRFVTGGEHGQYFTPQHITEFMCELVGAYNDNESVSDPACGSGRFLLSAIKRNRNIVVNGIDLDSRCVNMSILNMFLWSATGSISHGNALTFEIYATRQMGIYNGMPYLRQVNVTDEVVEEIKEAQQKTVIIEQMSLF